MASTPVIAVHPDENAFRMRNSVRSWTPGTTVLSTSMLPPVR